MEEWVNDSEYYCEHCEITFKVYVKNEDPTVNFCPTCGMRDFVGANED